MENLDLLALGIVALLVEAVVETIKPLWDSAKRKELPDRGAALGVGLLVAIFGGIDIFDRAGFPLVNVEVVGHWPGMIFTGILLSRPASFFHSLLKSLEELPTRIRGGSS